MTADMDEEPEQEVSAKPIKTRKRKHRAGAGMTASLLLACAVLGIAALVLTGRAVPLPAPAKDALVSSINERLTGARVTVDRVALAIENGRSPKATLRGVIVSGTEGNALAALNRVDVLLSPGALLQGRVTPEQVTLVGAQVTLRRRVDGSFALQSGDAEQAEDPISVSAALAALDAAFEAGPLAALGEVEATGVVISLEDARSGRIWQATNARLIMRERTEGISVSIVSDVFNGSDDIAEVQMSLTFDETTRDTSIGFRLLDVPAADIALQSPALGWLGVLDAPLAGAVRATLAGDGALTSLDGTLDIEAGVVKPDPRAEPVAFDAASAYFTYDPEEGRLDFDQIGLQSTDFRVTASGHTYLSDTQGRATDVFVGQFNVSEAIVRAADVFDAPVSLDRAMADLRLTVSPFSLEIANLYVEDGDVRAHAQGFVSLNEGRWSVDIDAEADRIDAERVKTFWPKQLAPKTRGWLARNVLSGDLSDVSFGVRYLAGTEPDLSLSFDYDAAEVRFLRAMPVVQDGRGRATLNAHEFVIEVADGWLTSPDGGTVNGAGTVFTVPDTRKKPADGVLDLAAEGELSSILSVIDQPPLRLMARAGRPTALARASARVEAEVALPLKDGITAEEVSYNVAATARDVSSDLLVPERQLVSPALSFRASPKGLAVRGRGTLDGMPFETSWELPLGPDGGEGSRAIGSALLNADIFASFGVTLPNGTLRGESRANYDLAMAPNAPPELSVTSDLRGLGVSIPALGWSKAPSANGGLDLDVTLGAIPDVTRMEFSAPGLALSGDVDFTEEGQVSLLRLEQLRVGSWLDARARVRPRGGGRAPDLSIDGGRLDLRSLPETRGGNGTSPSNEISLNLDSVVVTEGITLAPFWGAVTPQRGGLDGDFEARVAGRTLVRGTLVPAFGSTALRLQSDDAGGVLRDAGLTQSGRGGAVNIAVTPVSGAPEGTYDGEFTIANMRLEDAPVLAGLLNAISVVGLLDQLSGNGLSFSEIEGRFRITPDRVILREFAAVGPSLGISAEGVYDPATKELDMQGVVSPIYFVNGIGSLLTRRGEGLFGFNYRLTGPTNRPQVSVNPLSILTPGMFREIFRRPVPTE